MTTLFYILDKFPTYIPHRLAPFGINVSFHLFDHDRYVRLIPDLSTANTLYYKTPLLPSQTRKTKLATWTVVAPWTFPWVERKSIKVRDEKKKKTIEEDGNRIEGRHPIARNDRSSIVPPFDCSITTTTRERRRENPLNERIIFRPLSPPPYTRKRVSGSVNNDCGRPSSKRCFQTFNNALGRSHEVKVAAKVSCFSPLRRRGGVSWVCFDGTQNGTAKRSKLQGWSEFRRLERRWWKKARRSRQKRNVSIFRNRRIIAAKRMSSIHLLDNILFYPDYSAKFTCRMNYVVQVLLVKFRSKYQSNQPSFEFLDSMYIEVTTGL